MEKKYNHFYAPGFYFRSFRKQSINEILVLNSYRNVYEPNPRCTSLVFANVNICSGWKTFVWLGHEWDIQSSSVLCCKDDEKVIRIQRFKRKMPNCNRDRKYEVSTLNMKFQVTLHLKCHGFRMVPCVWSNLNKISLYIILTEGPGVARGKKLKKKCLKNIFF